MWTSWHVGTLRYDWVGVTLTGVAVGGGALLLHALVGFFAGLHRKFDDEAQQIERGDADIRKIA